MAMQSREMFYYLASENLTPSLALRKLGCGFQASDPFSVPGKLELTNQTVLQQCVAVYIKSLETNQFLSTVELQDSEKNF